MRAAILALLLLAGCNSVKPPRLTVQGARVEPAAGGGSTLILMLDADNRNAKPLPLRGVTYDVWFGGRRLPRATRSAQVTLPAFGRQRLELPAPLPDAPAAGSYRVRGKLQYVPPGAINESLADTGLVKPAEGFAGEGSL